MSPFELIPTALPMLSKKYPDLCFVAAEPCAKPVYFAHLKVVLAASHEGEGWACLLDEELEGK